jgi:hypothetical protein
VTAGIDLNDQSYGIRLELSHPFIGLVSEAFAECAGRLGLAWATNLAAMFRIAMFETVMCHFWEARFMAPFFLTYSLKQYSTCLSFCGSKWSKAKHRLCRQSIRQESTYSAWCFDVTTTYLPLSYRFSNALPRAESITSFTSKNYKVSRSSARKSPHKTPSDRPFHLKTSHLNLP